MGITEELYFPTPIFAGRLDEAPQLNPALLDLIYAERGRTRRVPSARTTGR